jgi:nitrile hydratase subunit beta
MNGVHDMGGMHGLGAIEPEPDVVMFHDDWERRVHAMVLAVGGWGRSNIDAGRHARESIPGPDYLRMSYYEKWFTALLGQLVEGGLVTAEELASGRPAEAAAKASPPLSAERVPLVLLRRGSYRREVAEPPAFSPGDRVRARNLNPRGHTRLPRYARGRTGVVEAWRGAHVFPDSNAHFKGEDPRHLYTVRFSARELWGEDADPKHSVSLDLWEPYLEQA